MEPIKTYISVFALCKVKRKKRLKKYLKNMLKNISNNNLLRATLYIEIKAKAIVKTLQYKTCFLLSH